MKTIASTLFSAAVLLAADAGVAKLAKEVRGKGWIVYSSLTKMAIGTCS